MEFTKSNKSTAAKLKRLDVFLSYLEEVTSLFTPFVANSTAESINVGSKKSNKEDSLGRMSLPLKSKVSSLVG